ncbi:MAG: septum formation initiator family protein [Deltaproteobacteria bacterium]|nr:septum formation initiator family protein [Deltaproteobacteria bacterium]MCL5792075.1 septum formation initiator family protein [Deltaproteobacteria bacterium]
MKWFNRFLFIFALALAFYTIFSRGGLYDLWKSKKTVSQLKNKRDHLLEQDSQLAGEIKLLENNDFYIEKIAREELGMAKKNEIIIRFKKNKIGIPVTAPTEQKPAQN